MKLGFIGCGNMGSAMAAAAAKACTENDEIYLSNRTRQKAEALAETLPHAVVSDNETVAAVCNQIVLGVKPGMLAALLASLRETLLAREESPVLINMAAGVSSAMVQEMVGAPLPVITVKPNTPVCVGAGVVAYNAAENVSEADLAEFSRLFAHAGLLIPLPESLLDAAGALSGCGPAFVYLFIGALADGGVAMGLPRGTAQQLAALTVLGSGKMALESGEHPEALKDAVCSPAGSTIAGVAALERGAFRGTVLDALSASFEKTKTLASPNGK